MTLSIYDFVVGYAEIEQGRSPQHVAARGAVHLNGVQVVGKARKTSRWTEAEDQFLRENHGILSEEEIGSYLGRTKTGVRIRWKRELHLPAPSRAPDVYTSNLAAKLIGVDSHKITHFCDTGLIPCRIWGERRMRLINRTAFRVWVVNPKNWIYFDWRKIPDRHLRKLCRLRNKRWGDEWMTSYQVAQMHGVDVKDVQRLAYRGELPAVQTEASLCGRHKDRVWANWFVLRSDAEQARFYKGKGSRRAIEFSPAAEKWMLKARFELGWTYDRINRSMGSKVVREVIRAHILKLQEKRRGRKSSN